MYIITMLFIRQRPVLVYDPKLWMTLEANHADNYMQVSTSTFT